jgi:hypothetical protein
VVSNLEAGDRENSFGETDSASAIFAAWRLQKCSEESAAAQERQTARKRRMDLTGSRMSSSVIISSGRAGAAADGSAMVARIGVDAQPKSRARIDKVRPQTARRGVVS